MATSDAPRGIRNNNPTNMDFVLSNSPYKGEIRPSADSRFAQFDTMANGCRAFFVQAKVYYTKHGVRTYKQFVDRWAPPNENDTAAYVDAVCNDCGVEVATLIDYDDNDAMAKLCRAMINHENGDAASRKYVSDADIAGGLSGLE